MQSVACSICSKRLASFAGLSRHLLDQHKDISKKQYVINYFYNGNIPLCKCGCGKELDLAEKHYKFNDYIHNHHKPTFGKKMSVLTKQKISEKRKRFYIKNPKQKKNLALSDKEIIERITDKNYSLVSDIKEYKNNRSLLKFKCNRHDNIFESYMELISTNRIQCFLCRDYNKSKKETEIQNFINSIYKNNIETNSRSVINPYELDIYLPEKKLGIEYHGLFWHSEKKIKKQYHFQKFKLCEEKGIQLLQFYEDEWRDKQDICKSMIRNKLGLSNLLNYARNFCVIEDAEKEKIISFINENHLQGYTIKKPLKSFSLVDENKNTVFCITLRKPFTKNKDNAIELERVCSKIDCYIPGGFSRLLKYCIKWCKNNNINKIISYSDCRYSDGNVYKKNNFSFIKHTGIGYDYTDGKVRYNRFKFRAQNGKSEKEIAEENNVYKIHGAGNYLWEYSF